MSLLYVGAQTTETDTVNDLVVSLPSGLQQGDLVIVIAMTRNSTNDIWSEGGGTWTKIADLLSTDTRSTNFAAFYKFMGSSPDTTVTISQDGAAAGMAAIAAAYRGNNATVLDATTVTATGINSSDADPPAIVTQTNKAWVVAAGAASNSGTPSLTAPSGYTNATLYDIGVTNGLLFLASREMATAGSENPGAFTSSTSSLSDSWCAASIAIRPAVESKWLWAA